MSDTEWTAWENLKYEVWRLSRIIPRQRFCKRRWCIRLVTAYPYLRPTLCDKHNREGWMELSERIRQCSHERTRPNPDATAVLDRNPRVCLDCGVGIVGRRAEEQGA
ncbi:hypothetical protein ACIRON_02880 [Nocardioides sp. NPDC101246]|uniref:hypothetical protein n=1 Tax=Nocardioides sp. NPDC101246 TaxID=3364336 RepID=UPI0037FE2E52